MPEVWKRARKNLDRIHCPLILSSNTVIAKKPLAATRVPHKCLCTLTHPLKHSPHFSSPSRGTSSTSQEELNKVMVFYSTETSRLHRTLLKQPMAGPRGKASNKESLSSAEGSWREQRFASGAAEGLSPPPVRKVLVFFGVMGGKHEGIQRFRGIHEAQSAGWSFQGRALQPIVQHWVLEHWEALLLQGKGRGGREDLLC